MDNIYKYGFLRVAAVVPPVKLAQPEVNAQEVIKAAQELTQKGVAVASFPELYLTGYSLDELHLSGSLARVVEKSLLEICEASKNLEIMLIVGLPLKAGNRLLNCAAHIFKGKIWHITPKTYLPNYHEFYEKRYFSSGGKYDFPTPDLFGQLDYCPTFGQKTIELKIADLPAVSIGTEICEDMWIPTPPSADLALRGAQVIFNLSASPVTVGRARRRKLMVSSLSARNLCAYVYAAAGSGESSTDLAWDGQAMIYQNGELLSEIPRFVEEITYCIADIDLSEIRASRLATDTYAECAELLKESEQQFVCPVDTNLNPVGADELLTLPLRFPFVPADKELLDQDCYEAYNIQVYGLVQRLRAIGKPKAVIGISGGLDSSHALIVAAQAMDQLGCPRKDILAYTLPGFATSDRTKKNAYRLCESLGVELAEIDIRPAAQQMLKDLRHPFAEGREEYDITFENVQAGLRTDYLFRLANQQDGIVIGTGDLSELALGWCTYGVGDQMSHYCVNAGVPKTLIQHLIRWVVKEELFGASASEALIDILNTEISPELVPAKKGEEIQSTQSLIGPYELHDFFLYYMLRGYGVSEIAFLAISVWGQNKAPWPVNFRQADKNTYTPSQICDYLEIFLKRFFNSQFKRTAIPNAPKVLGGGALSPRGDWRMPADVSAHTWLNELVEFRQNRGC